VTDPDSTRALNLDRAIAEIRAKEPPRDIVIDRLITAWHDLSTCRAICMAMGPIPFTAIVAWAEFNSLDHEEALVLKHVIRQLDNDHAEREESRRAHDRITGAR
jgi:hypothetical protein